MALLQSFQSVDEMLPDAQGILLQVFFFKNIQNREPCGARHRVAAKSAEKLHSAVERIGDFWRGDHRRERKAIAAGFAEDDNVRHDTLRLESPQMCSETPESDLHFVGNAHRARFMHITVDLREIARRKDHLPTHTR